MKSWGVTPTLEPSLCRTPWKRVYTKQMAKKEAKMRRKEGMYLYPYECACRWWHLTKKKQEGPSDETIAQD